MKIEKMFLQVKQALEIMESDFIKNINDKLFLDKKYGAKFNNIFAQKSLSLTGLMSILVDSFDIDISRPDLIICLDSISSTTHLELIKSVNIKELSDCHYEIRFK